MATEMEEVFPTHDLSGHRITTIHTHYRRLTSGCTTSFSAPDCAGSCSSCTKGAAKAKCKARQLKCKGSSIQGISFPFMADPASVLGLLSGKDIEIIEFRPPPLVFAFSKEISILLYAGGPLVYLNLGFSASVTLEMALVSNNKENLDCYTSFC